MTPDNLPSSSETVKALKELSAKWRRDAAVCKMAQARVDTHEVLSLCADHLDSLLASISSQEQERKEFMRDGVLRPVPSLVLPRRPKESQS